MADPKIVKPCPAPDCKGTLTIRRNKATDSEFLGCDQWPACKHTEPLPESIKMRRLGAPELLWGYLNGHRLSRVAHSPRDAHP